MHRAAPISALAAVAFVTLLLAGPAAGQQDGGYTDPAETRAALGRAQADARAAAARARTLEVGATTARAAVEKTQVQAAALAARIQESEAGIAAARARIALAREQREVLDRRLAVRREPLIRLTAGLQKLARRPLALSILKPGSLRETVYLRALLETTVPEVRRRTAVLRGEIARAGAIEAQSARALAALRLSERQLGERRRMLAAIESRQRLASRQASGAAAREADHALALAEQARDLNQLVGQLDAAGGLRRALAALPGPILRPARPGDGPSAPIAATQPGLADGAAPRFQLPVAGRIAAGFGATGADGVRAGGLSLAPADGAQAVAPASGRVVFAGPFRGFDRIVIIEHDGGFTSLITGLARADVAVGDTLVAGAPLGVVGPGHPLVTFELRRGGVPVNPLDWLR
jgi:septal ring factor EnvC (AmiA/AmiB activator)